MSIDLNGTTGITLPDASAGYLFGGITYLTTGTAATYTTPTGARALYVEVVGGGGGGGGVDGNGTEAAASGGGAGGGCAEKFIVSPDATYTYTVGAGGAGGVADTDGAAGGDSSFGSLTGGGGPGGVDITPSATDGFYVNNSGGSATGGDLNISGQPGGIRCRGDIWGAIVGGFGGGSKLGNGPQGNQASNNSLDGVSATNYGAGGSGAASDDSTANVNGGAGYQGVIRITVYY